MKERKDELSIFISLVLRHKPEAAGIEVDEHGWASVEDLIKGVCLSGRELDAGSLRRLVYSDSGTRFRYSADGTKIRANHGHSLKVDLELVTSPPPEVLYHGTAKRTLEPIMEQGIKRMERLYVHLHTDIDAAMEIGKRHGSPVVLKVYSGEMHKAGIEFCLSDDGVWLTDYVAPRYIDSKYATLKNKEAGGALDAH